MAATRFQLFRLSLSQRDQPDLFSGIRLSREQFLRDVFSKQYQFDHYNSSFIYIPDINRSRSDVVLGRTGRQNVVEENLPPEHGLLETSHDRWKAAVVVVDPVDHTDGQKVSIEIDLQVGRPLAIFTSLVNAINNNDVPAQYLVDVKPIVDSQSFWVFARENRGLITSLTFDFVTPNGLWSADTTLKSELSQVRSHIGAQRVTTKFASSDGLNTDDARVVEAVDYAASGSGTIKARAKGNKTFNSSQAPQTVILSGDSIDKEPIISKVARLFSQALGR